MDSAETVTQMSGGERQRLSLLRALSIRPQVLLLDEPCTGLDMPVKQEFLMMLREVADDYRILVIYVTHHPEETCLVADEILYMVRGQSGSVATVCHEGIAEFLENPPFVEAARVFAAPALNVIPGSIDGEVLRSEPDGATLGSAFRRGSSPGDISSRSPRRRSDGTDRKASM